MRSPRLTAARLMVWIVAWVAAWLLLPGQANADSMREAVVRGDLAAVQRFVKADPGVVNSRTRPGEVDAWEVGATPLHAAARNGHVEVAKFLLANAADINAQRRDGESALGEAAYNDRLDVAELLIHSGTKMSLPGQDGCTPLHWAAERASAAIVTLLIASGADVKARRTDGGTPLHAAAYSGNTPTIQALLAKGALLETPNVRGETPLHLAVVQGRGAAVELLLERGASPQAKDNTGKTPLQRGLAANKAEAVDALLHSVRIDQRFEQTQLSAAIQKLGAAAGIVFTLDAPLSGTITREFKAVPLPVALHTLLHDAEGGPLLYDLRDGALHIRSAMLSVNGGLERNDGKKADGFDFSAPGVALAANVAHTGRYCIGVACDGLHVSTFHTVNIPLPPPYDRPRRFLARAWIKARDLRIAHQGGWSAGHLMLWAHDAHGDKIKTMNPNGWDNVGLGEFAGYFSGTFDWREIKGNFVAPPGTASLSLEGGIGWATGTAWFDDLAVEEAPLAWEPQEDSEARVVVDTAKRQTRPVEGVGWNWSYIWDDTFEMNTSPELLDQLLHYAEWDQQSFVRFGFLAQRCLKDDWRKSPPVYDAAKPGAVFYERVLAGLNRLDARVLACNWQYGDGTGPYPKPPYPAERFAGGVAEVVGHWLTRDRFANIRWVSLWNEPDWWYKEGDYRGDFPLYWNALDARLRALGLRQRLGIVGADTTQGGSIAANAFPLLNARLGPSLDAFSAHDYFAAVEAPDRNTGGGVMQPYLRGYAATVTALGGKSLFVGEFGCGLGSDEAGYRGTLGGAELIVGGLNAGVRGFARWAYNHADTGSPSGFNPFVLVNGKLQPKRSVYYGYAVLTKAIRPGMQVVAAALQGGKDAEGGQRVHVTALTKAGGELSLILVNDGLQSKTVHVQGVNGYRLYHYFYDSTLPDGLQRGSDLASDDTTVVLKPMSINALTSWQWDRLKP